MEEIYNAHLRHKLAAGDGTLLVDFLRTLKRRYLVVYRDIALGYSALGGTVAAVAFGPRLGAPPLVSALIGGSLIGFWVAYLMLFQHEGAHYNLARSKTVSDRICDCLISWIIGTSVAQYRVIHFAHHRALGTTFDSEHTYFLPFNIVFIVKSITGIRALEVILYRQRVHAKKKEGPETKLVRPALGMSLVGFIVHSFIVLTSLTVGLWWLALAWVFGVGLVFPFVAATRQLLEHRKPDADRTENYFKVDHGSYTRIFDAGFFASIFGGAGFNRHLLHHWEPQISYTNLAELECFLAKTPMRSVMDEHRTTYVNAAMQLFHI